MSGFTRGLVAGLPPYLLFALLFLVSFSFSNLVFTYSFHSPTDRFCLLFVPDLAFQLNAGKFLDNGRCGYVLLCVV